MEENVIKPKVSVCVVTYNQEKYIRQCLQSIVDQNVDFEFEVLVGDDCSTDGTSIIVKEFVDRYPNLIRSVSPGTNIGPTENYLLVHNLASGNYVCHCDGDDYWLSNKLAQQVAVMDGDSSIAQTWHRQHLVDQHGNSIGVFPARFPKFIFGSPMKFLDLAHSYGLVGQHSSQMYRREARSVCTRDRPTIDYFFALDIAQGGLSVHIPVFLGAYRVAVGGSMTQSYKGRDIVDLCVIDAVEFFSKTNSSSGHALKANILVRALGAMIKGRLNWKLMIDSVSGLPTSLRSIVRSLTIFLVHKI